MLRHMYREVKAMHEITKHLVLWHDFAKEQYQPHSLPYPHQAQEFSQLMLVLSNHLTLLQQSEMRLFMTQLQVQTLFKTYLQLIPIHV